MRLDDAWLDSVGLSAMDPAEKDKFLMQVHETLEGRVGTVIAAVMSEDQLDAFSRLHELGEDEICLEFLADQVPSYQDMVRGELEKLAAEIIEAAPRILAAQ
jgi:hypothetical protein